MGHFTLARLSSENPELSQAFSVNKVQLWFWVQAWNSWSQLHTGCSHYWLRISFESKPSHCEISQRVKIIIHCVALAKQGDKVLGSIHLSVHLSGSSYSWTVWPMILNFCIRVDLDLGSYIKVVVAKDHTVTGAVMTSLFSVTIQLAFEVNVEGRGQGQRSRLDI